MIDGLYGDSEHGMPTQRCHTPQPEYYCSGRKVRDSDFMAMLTVGNDLHTIHVVYCSG